MLTSKRLLPMLLISMAGCSTTTPLTVPTQCYQVPPPPPRQELRVPGALNSLSKALSEQPNTTTLSSNQNALSVTPLLGNSSSWDQATLKAGDAGCPTAIYIAPGGVLQQCQK